MRAGNGTQVRWRKRLITLSLLLVLAGSAFGSFLRGSAAPPQAPPGPDRFSVTVVDYTKYFWWLVHWGETDVECEIEVDHEGLPTPGDIYVDCGQTLYNKWIKQEPCKQVDVNLCSGFYLVQVGSQPAQKKISTKLQAPTMQVTLENCSPVYTSSTSICESEPILVLTGIEPLPGYTITGIEGLYGGNQPFNCGPVCRLKLPVTGDQTFPLQFWAYSSYGDSSQIFNAQIRVAMRDEGNPDQPSYWYVDVLSDQWAGVPVATCVGAWGVLPPIGGPPQWLSTPTQSESLGTQIPYNYLAANLIRGGAVDASSCDNGGLLPDGGANNCGMDAARGAVNDWQNQFDGIILNVAKDTGVPAHLLKNLFAIESQFWPGNTKNDVGLGQLTEHGADTTLLWNPPFFKQFCPLVMDSGECAKGYLHLTDEQQQYVRLSLISAVNATCENCPLGIDLERAKFSIGVFAHTMLANCEQASQVVWNYNGRRTPDQLGISYEDMWKFTLANYNAGGGCLATAFEDANAQNAPKTWEGISPYLAPACQGAVEYVNQISGSNNVSTTP